MDNVSCAIAIEVKGVILAKSKVSQLRTRLQLILQFLQIRILPLKSQ
jgi:hypothetical protein